MPGLLSVHALSLAFKRACELIDLGSEVSQIEGTDGFVEMDANQIKRAYAERSKRLAIRIEARH
jgi:hypothetical protein